MNDESAIQPETWDSVDVLDLIALIDELYGVTVPMTDLNRSKTYGELLTLVRNAT